VTFPDGRSVSRVGRGCPTGIRSRAAMRNRLATSSSAGIVAAALVAALSACAAARQSPQDTNGTPRTPDGKPNFTGVVGGARLRPHR